MRWILSFMLTLSLVAGAETPLKRERVIGNEFPGKYKHPAAITELANGDLYIAYYGGGGEYEDDAKVWGMRKPKGEAAWSTPVVIADTPFLAEGNPVVWQAPDGTVWLYYVQRYGETWSDSRIKAKISKDNANTWSDNFVVAFEKGMMVRGKPIVLANGEYLVPIYHETGHHREIVGPDTTSLFLRYDPKTHLFTETNRIASRVGNLQPAPALVTPDYLVSYSRRGGGYDPVDDGYVVRSESRDGGKTWSPGTDSEFPNPNAAVDFIALKSGNLILIYNDSMSERVNLTAALSTDQDKTYPHRRRVATDGDDLAYPYIIQGADGTIHLIYTTDARSTIMHVSFTEDEIIGHRLEE